MKANQAEYAVATMCKVLELSHSGYYARLGRQPSKQSRSDAALLTLIGEEHLLSHGIYGAPRIASPPWRSCRQEACCPAHA